MKTNDTAIDVLVERIELPKSPSMDAIEAHLVTVSSKTELRFYAVRGEKRSLLRSAVSPRKPLGEMTETDLLVEILTLRADADRMRPVYETAKAWHSARGLEQTWEARRKLNDAIDAALATEDA